MSEPITDYGKIIARLASETDPDRRAQLGALLANRLEHAFGQSVDTVQTIRWQTEEWLRQRIGETNDMISQINASQKATKGEIAGGFDALHQALAAFRSNQEAAVGELRADFQQVAETVNEMVDDVAILKQQGIRQEAFNADMARQVDAIGTRLHQLEAGQAALIGRMDHFETGHATLAGRVDAVEQKLVEPATAAQERREIKAAVDTVHQRMDTFIASSSDEARQYRELLNELLQERRAKEEEAQRAGAAKKPDALLTRGG